MRPLEPSRTGIRKVGIGTKIHKKSHLTDNAQRCFARALSFSYNALGQKVVVHQQLLVKMTNVAFEDLFRSPARKFVMLDGMALKKCLQTKKPSVNCINCSCNARCRRFIMIPRFNGNSLWLRRNIHVLVVVCL